MTLPATPRGVTTHRPHRPDRGELVRWQVDGPGPWVEMVLMEATDGPRGVRVSVFPSTMPLLVADPAELEVAAWALLAASKWVAARRPPAPTDPIPSLFDLEEAAAHG